MSEVVRKVDDLSVKCVSDGWDLETGVIPEGFRDLKNYFNMVDQGIPLTDLVQYDILNQKPKYPTSYTLEKILVVVGYCNTLSQLAQLFNDDGITAVVADGFILTRV